VWVLRHKPLTERRALAGKPTKGGDDERDDRQNDEGRQNAQHEGKQQQDSKALSSFIESVLALSAKVNQQHFKRHSQGFTVDFASTQEVENSIGRNRHLVGSLGCDQRVRKVGAQRQPVDNRLGRSACGAQRPG